MVWSLLVSSGALADIQGTVVSAGGVAIEHARVDLIDPSEVAFTDAEGRFVFVGVEPPAQLVVTHPRFHSQNVVLEEADTATLQVTLVAKQAIFEEIVVSATPGEESFAPVSVAASVVDPLETPTPPTTLTEMVVEVPGVAENGQGGLFQVYSIRGVSRQRVLTLLEGTRVVSDRRAGVSASFIEPQLLESVDVVRGPSSTYYGSGALGGVVQLFPRRFTSLEVRAGYESQGDENYQALGWGTDGWSLGLARRDAGSAETPDGETIPSGFSQYSGTLRRVWETEGFEWNVLVVGSAGRDIEKASTDYPARETIYPEENHLMARLGLTADSGWTLSAWAHPNDLVTEVLQVGDSLTSVENESVELGGSWQQRYRRKDAGSVAVGVDYFGRRGVSSTESIRDLTGVVGDEFLQTLDDAEEDQVGVYGAVEWNMAKVSAVAGLRGTWQRQENSGASSADDSAASGFVGLVTSLGQGFELAANLGAGLRFPTLSERFFSGTTGRGGVVGNPDLDSERSLSFDLGLRWYGERLFVTAAVFRNEIDDYIERIEIEEDLLTFVNLTSGTIEGLELQATYSFRPSLSLTLGGHLMDGEAEDGTPLADIPANRLDSSLRQQGDRWGSRVRWEYREEKTEVGSGEKPIPSVLLLSANLSFALNERLTLILTGDNLLDEKYFSSADRKVPLSAGRSIGLAVAWTGD
jgi:iron complex outermembrane receptor protein